MIANIIMRPPMLKQIAVGIIQILLIILFTYAALSKIMDYHNFRFELGRSPYITHIAGFTAWALPTGELLIASLLVFQRTVQLGLYASYFLMVLFTGYIYIMLKYSYFLPCNCGGILNKLGWNEHLYFNIIFTLLALTGIIVNKQLKAAHR